jgi:archaellum component FlaC
MDENNNGSAIKLLVDALSSTLKNLSDKISSFQPILSQITQTTDNGAKEINEILHDIKTLERTFNDLCKDFYSRTDVITKNVELFHIKMEELIKNVEQLTIELSDLFEDKVEIINKLFNEKTTELGNMLETKTEPLNKSVSELESQLKKTTTDVIVKINDVSKNIRPIGKVISFITKPIGFLIFVIGLIIASITITNCVSSITDYLHKSQKTYQTDK